MFELIKSLAGFKSAKPSENGAGPSSGGPGSSHTGNDVRVAEPDQHGIDVTDSEIEKLKVKSDFSTDLSAVATPVITVTANTPESGSADSGSVASGSDYVSALNFSVSVDKSSIDYPSGPSSNVSDCSDIVPRSISESSNDNYQSSDEIHDGRYPLFCISSHRRNLKYRTYSSVV